MAFYLTLRNHESPATASLIPVTVATLSGPRGIFCLTRSSEKIALLAQELETVASVQFDRDNLNNQSTNHSRSGHDLQSTIHYFTTTSKQVVIFRLNYLKVLPQ